MSNYQVRMNAFLPALVNKIVYTEVRTKSFQNPISRFKKSNIPFGFHGEFIHVNPAELKDYTRPNAPAFTNPFSAENPVVFADYLEVNEDKIASVLLSEDYLNDAFSSWEKFDEMVQSIINSLYSGNQAWEYSIMKETLADAYDNNNITKEAIDNIVDETSGNEAIIKIKNAVEYMRIPSEDYNTLEGAVSFVEPENMVIVMTADFKNRMDVLTRAGAFNVSNLDFLPPVVVVDKIDDEGTIKAIVMDEAFLQIRDKKFGVDSIFNPADWTLNYWLRRRTMRGVIRFANAVAFYTE